MLCYRQRPDDLEEFVLPNYVEEVPEVVTTKEAATIEVVIDISYEAIMTLAIKGKNSDCSICIEEIKHSEVFLILPVCGHRFHYTCVNPWLEENKTCPMCRTCVREVSLTHARGDDLKEALNYHRDLLQSRESNFHTTGV